MFLEPVLEERPWSPSKAQTALKCPLAYHLKYRLKVKDDRPGGTEARVGTTTHALYEWGLRDDLPDASTVLGESRKADEAPTAVPVSTHTEEELDRRLPYLLDLFSREERNQLDEDSIALVRSFLPRVKSFILGMQRIAVKYGVEVFYLEHRAALDVNMKACGYNDPTALIRGVMDMGYRTRDGMYVVIDHKTGKPKSLGDYNDQLNSYKLFVIETHPDIIGVQCGVNHTRKEHMDWAAPETREHIERNVKAWLQQYLNGVGLKLAQLKGREDTPKPTPLCNWCGYADFTKKQTDEGKYSYAVGFEPDDVPVCPEGIAAIEKKPMGPRLERQRRSLPLVGRLP